MFSSLKTKPVISSEMIAVQKDDWFPQYLTNQVEAIFNKHRVGSKVDITTEVLDIEDNIQKRFGFPCKILINKGLLMVEKYGFDTRGGITNMSEIIDFISAVSEEKQSNLYKRVMRNVQSLDSWCRVNGIVINNAKARIDNLPTKSFNGVGFKPIIHINFNMLYHCSSFCDRDDGAITPAEVAAGILHEIGHCFTFLSYATKSRSSLVVFEDVLQDQAKKGLDSKDCYLIAFKEAFNRDLNIKDYEGKDIKECLIGTLNEYSSYSLKQTRYSYEGHMQSARDAEFVADQFANRFGMGKEMASFIAKVETNIGKGSFLSTLTDTMIFFIYIVASIALAVLSSPLLGIGMLIAPFILRIVFCSIGNWATEVLRTMTSNVPYDSEYRRIERMYLEIIRQIRLYPDTVDKEALIKQSKIIKAILDDLVSKGLNDTSTLATTVTEFFFSSFRDKRKMEELNNKLENCMENELYLSASLLELK